MGDYSGDAAAVALQRAIRGRIEEISAEPLLANGGRVLNILDPDAYGWDRVRGEVERDGVVALSMVDREATLERLAAEFGPEREFPVWDAFTGPAAEVLAACARVTAETPAPEGWALSHHLAADDAAIAESHRLNLAAGVLPTPAYYLRGEHVPALLTCLRAEDGRLAACASATMRYHPEGPLGGWVFAGGVSVDPAHRRRGLGALVNAALLAESHARFGWSHALEQARADNAASVRMIRRCGLARHPRRATIAVIAAGRYFTR